MINAIKDEKFTHFFENSEYEIMTNEGYMNFVGILQTVPYEVYILKTKYHTLECADKHIVFMSTGDKHPVFVKDLKPGQFIQVEENEKHSDIDEVISIEKTERIEEMYDIQITENEKFSFYTNGVLSHNTKFFEMLSGIIEIDGEKETKTEEQLKNESHRAMGKILIGEKLEPVSMGKVGVVQQNYPLFNHLTIYHNMDVAAIGKHKDAKLRKDMIEDILTRFDLITKKNDYPAQLSGGQKQRAAIAQQILCSNNFLLMDEPFSGLDINMVHKVSDLIVKVANMHELNTVILVSHDIVSTAAISDTLWIMGRDRDLHNNIIPGSKIKYQYDLIERDLAWKPGIEATIGFHALIDEIRALFPTL